MVLTEEDSNKFHDEIKSLRSSKPIKVVNGGESRQQSVYNGLVQADESSDLICIHDAVRPFVNEKLIKKSLEFSLFFYLRLNYLDIMDLRDPEYPSIILRCFPIKSIRNFKIT